MTEKLFYTDPTLRKFAAEVLACRKEKEGYAMILNRTAFYPEGGGQPGDRGYLCTGTGEQIAVRDTREENGEILHLTDAPLMPGTMVEGSLDWDYRFDLMQNHSGEHIVSGLIHRRFGYNNVGFHMGKDLLTIDLDGELSWTECQEIEAAANRIVCRDLPVQIRIYSQEEAADLVYRSKKELTGEIRIVTFPEADVCACCGTHVTRTGEIGLIKLLSVQKFRKGVRIEMLCGLRAMNYMRSIYEQNRMISELLSARPLEISGAVQHLKEAENTARIRNFELEMKSFRKLAESYAGKGNVILFEEGLSPDGVRRLCVEVMETCGGICAVFSGSDPDGYKYAIGQKDGNLREWIRAMNQALCGRGGGKPFFAQGSVAVRKEKILDFWKQSEQS